MENQNINFVQIGSNDGFSNDPIHDYITKYNWRGVLVEPVNMLYQKLKNTYSKNSNLVIVKYAIGVQEGELDIYRIDEKYFDDLPNWFFQLASLKKEVILSHSKFDSRIKDLIVCEKVKVISINKLLSTYGFENINLLHLDTEGYDFEILNSFDFKAYHPDIILFEHKHLSLSELSIICNKIESNRYILFSTKFDTICLSLKLKNATFNLKKLPFYYKSFIYTPLSSSYSF